MVRAEYGGANASHLLRIDGATLATAPASASPTLAGALGRVMIYREAVMDVVAMFAIGHATINDTQAAQIETDLLTIMGL